MRLWLRSWFERSLGARASLLSPMSSTSTAHVAAASPPAVLVVLGATGVGKSRAAIELAKRLDGEVVNVDAMQMYQGLDVATAKVTAEEIQDVRHHLLSFLSPTETYTVKDFRNRTLPLIEEIQSRGKQVILVGGTLYYIQAVLWPSLIDEAPEPESGYGSGYGSMGVVSEKEKVTVKEGGDYSYERLCALDPEMAQKLHPNDRRKIRRSIEIYEETGERNSVLIKRQRETQRSDELRLQCLLFWLGCDPDVHKARLKSRIDDMMRNGLLEEARSFNAEYGDQCRVRAHQGIFQSMGYKEFDPVFECEKDEACSEAEKKRVLDGALERLLTRHLQYTKKQLQWIRNRLLPRNAPVVYYNTSSLENWESAVMTPMCAVAKRFIRSSPSERTLEAVSKFATVENATWEEDKQGREAQERFCCELCHSLVVLGRKDWEAHLKGRKHRFMKKRATKRAMQVQRQQKSVS